MHFLFIFRSKDEILNGFLCINRNFQVKYCSSKIINMNMALFWDLKNRVVNEGFHFTRSFAKNFVSAIWVFQKESAFNSFWFWIQSSESRGNIYSPTVHLYSVFILSVFASRMSGWVAINIIKHQLVNRRFAGKMGLYRLQLEGF